MTVAELIEKLKTFPPDLEVWWHDAIEGNDCEAVDAFLTVSGKTEFYDPPGVVSRVIPGYEVVMISPCPDGDCRPPKKEEGDSK